MDDTLQIRIKRAAEAIKALGAREVYIFGSAATGTMRPGSDVDFAVSGLPPQNFFPAMGAASDVLDIQIDLVDLDEENPFTRYLKSHETLIRLV